MVLTAALEKEHVDPEAYDQVMSPLAQFRNGSWKGCRKGSAGEKS